MHQRLRTLAMATVLTLSPAVTMLASAERFDDDHQRPGRGPNVQLGPRPFYLVEQMTPSRLKDTLQQCAERPSFQSDFSIGHRGGAALQFPEHTRESHEAGARMGAGILECDVTFTRDGELVCRHAQCDLHTTTNILATDLATTCRVPFTPATADQPARALCCTTDITLEEFKSLKGKMDASNPRATTVEEYLGGTAPFRTDLYATGAALPGQPGGTLLSHKESIRLIKSLGAKFTPELKGVDRTAGVPIVPNNGFGDSGLDQQSYASKMIQEYIDAGIDPRHVYAQSFNLEDVLQWIAEFPKFGKQAVYLINDVQTGPLTGNPSAICCAGAPPLEAFKAVKNMGVKIVAPPMPTLLTHSNGAIVPSEWARRAKKAGLEIISWTTERSGRIIEDVKEGGNTFYYQTTLPALENDGDIMLTLDVLARQVGILGIFSDWSATVTYYANCMGLR